MTTMLIERPVVVIRCSVCDHGIPGAEKQEELHGVTPTLCPTCTIDQERLFDDLDHWWEQ